jgi:hypothetical protein
MKSPVIPSIRTHDDKAFRDDVKRALDSIRGYYKGKDVELGKVIIGAPYVSPPSPPVQPLPPNPPPTGWIDLNGQIGITSFYGYNAAVGGAYYGPVIGGQAYSFFIDPPSVSYSGKPTIMVGDVSQGTGCSLRLFTLDALNNRVTEYIMRSGSSNQYSVNLWGVTPVYNNERLLLIITPQADIQSMFIYWF